MERREQMRAMWEERMARRHDYPFPPGPPTGFPWWLPNGYPTHLSDEVEHQRYPSLTFGPAGGGVAMRVPLAIANKKICKGQSERLEAVSQRFGKIVALVIPRLIANQVAIGTITVGVEIVNAGLTGLVPGDYFAADSFHSNMNTFTCIPNQPIFIEVVNIGDADLCFYGAFTLEVVAGPGVHLYGKVRDQ
jgi:hypothetical protein